MGEQDKAEKTIIVTLKPEHKEKPSSLDPFLIPISGRETGHAIALKGKTLKIGRDAGCDLVLDNPQISRVHAELFWKDSELFLRDLGSTNGVFINGKKIEESRLQSGDKILIGTQMYFKFVYQDSADQNYHQSLFKAANTDSLTQLYNKRYFIELLEREFSFSRRTGQPLSLLMMDVDFFKKINDAHGHLAGDKVLKLLGQVLTKQLRLENIACRFGGEEFGIILRGANPEMALQVGERIRKQVEVQKVSYRNREFQFTVSVGIATFDGKNFSTSEELMQKADELLYQAKQKGRNRTFAEAA